MSKLTIQERSEPDVLHAQVRDRLFAPKRLRHSKHRRFFLVKQSTVQFTELFAAALEVHPSASDGRVCSRNPPVKLDRGKKGPTGVDLALCAKTTRRNLSPDAAICVGRDSQ